MLIPRSIKYEIAKHLERNDIRNLRVTCKSWHKCLSENYFWEFYFKKIYPHDKLENFLEDCSNYKRLALHIHHTLLKFQTLEIDPPFTSTQYFPPLGVCEIATGEYRLQSYIQEIWRGGKFERQIIVKRDNTIITMTTLEEPQGFPKIKIFGHIISFIDAQYNLYALVISIVNLHKTPPVFSFISANVKDAVFRFNKWACVEYGQ